MLESDGLRQDYFTPWAATLGCPLEGQQFIGSLQIRKGPGKDAAKRPDILQRIADLTQGNHKLRLKALPAPSPAPGPGPVPTLNRV